MRENEFRSYLENIESIKSKNKAINSRISRANTAEEIVEENLDYVVADDTRMYDALVKISTDSRERSGNIQNAVRWYYRFCNSKEFPRMSSFKKINGCEK